MAMISPADARDIVTFIRAARENLDRIESIIDQGGIKNEDDIDPGSPLNKSNQFLTKRGVEVCYRLFDMGKTRYAVAEAMKISYGAATHRFHAWEKLGGRNRDRQPLD